MDPSGSDWYATVRYPATKAELIEAATAADAPQELIERLQRLEGEQYDTPGELERELAEAESQG